MKAKTNEKSGSTNFIIFNPQPMNSSGGERMTLRHLRVERKVLNMFSKENILLSCFSSRAEEQFDQTLRKFE